MAGIPLVHRCIGVQVPTTTAKVIGYITAPANQRLKLKRVVATMPGAASGNAMVKGEIVKCTTAGTLGGSGGNLTAAPTKTNSSQPETPQSTGCIARTDSAQWTTPPTVTDTDGTQNVHPVNGYFWEPTEGEREVPGGERRGFQLTTQGQAQTVDLEFHYEE